MQPERLEEADPIPPAPVGWRLIPWAQEMGGRHVGVLSDRPHTSTGHAVAGQEPALGAISEAANRARTKGSDSTYSALRAAISLAARSCSGTRQSATMCRPGRVSILKYTLLKCARGAQASRVIVAVDLGAAVGILGLSLHDCRQRRAQALEDLRVLAVGPLWFIKGVDVTKSEFARATRVLAEMNILIREYETDDAAALKARSAPPTSSAMRS